MPKLVSIFILLLASVACAEPQAQPDRDSLIDAWESHVRSLPGTTSLEATGDDTYRYADTDLPYEGELTIIGALVRSADSAGFETDFTHLGMVDFELADLPPERLSSQVYYYWLADRQTMHYSESQQAWVSTSSYQASISDRYGGDKSFSTLSFMLNYGIWILLVVLLGFVFVSFSRQAKKARSLMDDTASINQMARENLDKAKGMQDEVLAIARESRDLQSENNELIRRLVKTMENRD